ncbi:hypothetical protein [Chitinophaga sp. MM2321]|uniref:hypothetical protein n=1 Tax=Chitinophaga sp. MM2321 TaxID=3137178 RepID=UPI0032D5A666
MEKNKTMEVAKVLNNSVLEVLTSEKLLGFEKAYMIASAVQELKKLLTPEYMKPIMALQGNKLGFKTDKDKDGGYPEEAVKNCLVEAVLMGVQPFGNQFNIIAGNSYITKEGFGYLLSNISGLSWKIIPQLPRVGEKSAAIVMKIQWTYGGVSEEQDIDFPIKVNAFMGTDGVIGKATRKARAWLFYTVTGSEISDGDVQDIDAKIVSTTINETKKTPQEIEAERIGLLIQDTTTIKELEALKQYIQPFQKELYEEKLKSLS